MSGEASKGLVRSCDGQGIEAELGLEWDGYTGRNSFIVVSRMKLF
jgi:hypothetical protein